MQATAKNIEASTKDMKSLDNNKQQNVDASEIKKFEDVAHRWWDMESEFKALHDINPLRLDYIDSNSGGLDGKKVIDVGCGGGILSESMALRGANTLGIDMGKEPLSVAELHALDKGVDNIEYRQITAEEIASEQKEQFDVVTCMEMLEHVPDPSSIIKSCADLVKPGGSVFFSTLNRNPKSYALAIVGAEYLLRMLPRGTHDFSKFIRPSELETWARQATLHLENISGMTYNPIFKNYTLGNDVSVNYLMYFTKP
jgi:2-polyprenyl-6-hydroxyphenyl methylase/3-demethylubiquinone-9 3-methyltransferase